MPIITESCKEIGWQQRLECNLKDGLEVDLVSFKSDYDFEFCHALAQKYRMKFDVMKDHQYGRFRKQ